MERYVVFGVGFANIVAVTFCYYEILLRLGNRQKFLEEEVRIKSLSNLIKESGFDEMLYEDFVDDTLMLLRETSRATDGGAELVAAFNDYNRSQSIITCIKVVSLCDFGRRLTLLTFVVVDHCMDEQA
jgi:ubiquitin thioesterase protein OTUB1